MNRIAILEGFAGPFGAHKRRKHKGGRKHMQSKMKACAHKWKRSGKHGKYTSFMKKCLKGRR